MSHGLPASNEMWDHSAGDGSSSWVARHHEIHDAYQAQRMLGVNNGVDGGFNFGSLAPELSPCEKALSWFKLVYCCLFIPFATMALVLLYRSRKMFEIRARSAYLCMLFGGCVVAGFTIAVNVEAYYLFGRVLDPYGIAMGYYFFLVCTVCSYACRIVRLAVIFNPQAKKLLPGLIPERNYVAACLIIATSSLVIPLYDRVMIGDEGPNLSMKFAKQTNERLWTVEVVFEGLTMVMYPLVRNVDDIFDIGPELKILMLLQLALTVGARLSEWCESEHVGVWINSTNLSIIAASVAFGITIIDPLRRLHFGASRNSDPDFARALARRKQPAFGLTISPVDERDSQGTSAPLSENTLVSGSSRYCSNRITSRGESIWTWERIEAHPELAAAFEEFARKALCQESVLFLREVSRFRAMDTGDEVLDEQIVVFQQITRKFIFDGSPDEVNISSSDKRELLELYNAGPAALRSLPTNRRRCIFGEPFMEIRYMLEANLMRRFVTTDEFRGLKDDIEARCVEPTQVPL